MTATAEQRQDAHGRLIADRDQLNKFIGALFRYADDGTFASLRTFLELEEGPPVDIRGVLINGDAEAFAKIVAGRADLAANYEKPSVFLPANRDVLERETGAGSRSRQRARAQP
jgi:hypothetical protein